MVRTKFSEERKARPPEPRPWQGRKELVSQETTSPLQQSFTQAKPNDSEPRLSKKDLQRHAAIPKKLKELTTPSPQPKMEVETYDFAIPRKEFHRVCKKIGSRYMDDCRFELEALDALQLSCENFMVAVFEDVQTCMDYANRKTMGPKDLKLVTQLRKIDYETL